MVAGANNVLRAEGDKIYKDFQTTDAGKEIMEIPLVESYNGLEPKQPLVLGVWNKGDTGMGAQSKTILGTWEMLQKIDGTTKYTQKFGQSNRNDDQVTPFDCEMLDKSLNVTVVKHVAEIVDVAFHARVKEVLGDLLLPYQNTTDGVSGYYRGPIKDFVRMAQKIFDYRDQPFPRAACIVDPNRATFSVKTPAEVKEAYDRIMKWMKFVRVKNRYHRLADADFLVIMINVLFQAHGLTIIAEIQLTTIRSLELKKLQHKMYKLQRAFGLDSQEERSPEDVFEAIKRDVCKF